MGDLATLALQRAQLPHFPGASLPEQLVAGRDAARAALLQYVPSLAYDPADAAAVVRAVSIWQEQHANDLGSQLQDPSAQTLPEALRLQFNSDKAQQFILSGYTLAAVGIGPWLSGRVASETARADGLVQQRWAEEDAQHRLVVFGNIVKLQEQGYLEQVFRRPVSLGFLPVAIEGSTLIWALVVVAVAVAALVLTYLFSAEKLRENNRLMGELCKKAQTEGDKTTVDLCVKEAAGLQKQSMFPGLDDALGTLGWAAAIVVLAWGAMKIWASAPSRRRATT
jgi:hypothetical protein